MIDGCGVETVIDVLSSLAVIAAAGVAWRGIHVWRDELVGRRRAELAEEILTLVYEAKEIIETARSPFSLTGEGESRPSMPGETADQASRRNAYYAPAERLHSRADFWGKFDAARYRFMAVFGEDAGKKYVKILQARNKVMLAAKFLVQRVGNEASERDSDRRRMDQLEADIGWVLTEEDEFADKVDVAVKEIEEICRPAIEAANTSILSYKGGKS